MNDFRSMTPNADNLTTVDNETVENAMLDLLEEKGFWFDTI